MKYISCMGLFSLLSLSLLLGCTPSAKVTYQDPVDLLTEIQQRGVLKVGTEGTYSPNSYHDQQGNLVGFDVDVARKIAEQLNVEIEFVEGKWDSLFASMDAGRIDLVINEVEYSQERALKYDFSLPYTYVHGALLVSQDNQDITTFTDLSEKKAAQNLTSSWGSLAESFGAELVGIDTLDQAIELLQTKRVDATLNSETAFRDYLNQKPGAPVKIVVLSESTTSSVIPVKKGNESLVIALNQAIEQLRQSGQLTELSNQYFGFDITTGQ